MSEEGVAHAQRPVAGGAELGELGVDVHVDGAEEVDVLAVRRGAVGQDPASTTSLRADTDIHYYYAGTLLEDLARA